MLCQTLFSDTRESRIHALPPARPCGRPFTGRHSLTLVCPATEGGGFLAHPSQPSPTVIPDALQHEVVLRRAGIHAPLDPRHKAEGDIEENLHNLSAQLPPPWQGKQRDKRRGEAQLRPGLDNFVDALAQAKQREIAGSVPDTTIFFGRRSSGAIPSPIRRQPGAASMTARLAAAPHAAMGEPNGHWSNRMASACFPCSAVCLPN